MESILPLLATPTFVLALVLLLALAFALAFAMHTPAGHQLPRPPSLNSPPITMLPTEIIQHIASFLPPSGAASFASTCLCIRLAAGTQYLSALRASRTEILALLELLLADAPHDPIVNFPSRLLCADCARLIPIYIGCGASATSVCRKTWDLSTRYIVSSFSPPIFYTIMAMHRHGHQCDELLSRIAPPTTTRYTSSSGIASQHTVHYRIATTGPLLIRTQVTYIFSHPPLDDREHTLGSFCHHIGGKTERFSTTMKLVQTEAPAGPADRSPSSSTATIAGRQCS